MHNFSRPIGRSYFFLSFFIFITNILLHPTPAPHPSSVCLFVKGTENLLLFSIHNNFSTNKIALYNIIHPSTGTTKTVGGGSYCQKQQASQFSPSSMNSLSGFAFSPSNALQVRAFDWKAANFDQIPLWVSLKSTPSPLETSSKVENVHLASLCNQGKLKEATEFVRQMENAAVSVNPRSFQTLLQACGNFKSLSEGRLIHQQLRRTIRNPPAALQNCLLQMYCNCGSLVDAHQVFDEMVERNLSSWTTMISAYAQMGLLDKAIDLLSNMLSLGIEPNSYIYTRILRSLSSPSHLEIGKQLYSHAIRSGLGSHVNLNTATSNAYIKCGWLEGAELLFHCMAEKNIASWTGLMVGFTQSGREKDSLLLFTKMVSEGVELDEYVFSTVLKASAGFGDLNFGRQIHGHLVKLGLESHVSVGTALVDFYVKFASLECACKAFDGVIEPNDVSWSALITGYCQMGEFEEAFKLFISLRSKGLDLNSFTYTSILQASAALADFNAGTQIHADAIKRCLIAEQYGESAMVTMYSRCGKLDCANRVFESIPKPDTVAWTAIIAGYAYQGNATEALKYFRRMEGCGARPNEITFIAILTACSHAGMVTEGRRFLDSMKSKYDVVPTIDHYDCMIDIYSRAGYLQEALQLINTMPFAPDAMSWKCLLGGCWAHKNLEYGKIAAKNLLQLDPEDVAGYLLMFNLYVSFGKWREAASIRATMAERNLKRDLSRSWITVKGKVHRFVVGDKHHPRREEIYAKLEELKHSFAKENNDLIVDDEDTSSILLEREAQLLDHSERLAIAFGLISSTASNAPVVVFKNLRACKDCHEFAKHVSLLTGREIVVRDSSRFHHCKSGKCSCNDYW